VTQPIRVACGSGRTGAKAKWDLELTYAGRNPSIHVGLHDLARQLTSAPKDTLLDLFRIAAFVYAADRRVGRGGPADVFGHKWPRDFSFRIPVTNPSLWKRREVVDALSETLRFATDDSFRFNFVKGSVPDLQIPLPFTESLGPAGDSDLVLLFSGGIDSTVAALRSVNDGRRPLLVSHQAAPKVLSRQMEMLRELRTRLPTWTFPHVYGRVTLAGGGAKEESQRSRAFLFLSIATLVASEYGIREIHIADNGVTSLNLPRSGQTVGAMASRSTHPRFLRDFHHLVQLLIDRAPKIVNPLLFLTKAETVRQFREFGRPELLQLTFSCSHTFASSEAKPHCGTCFQCVDRRFATLHEGLQEFDLAGYYATDIFQQEVSEGEPRVNVVNALRFAQELRSTPVDSFAYNPAFMDALDPEDGDSATTYESLVSLLKRHGTQVAKVIEGNVAVKDFLDGFPAGSVGWLLGRSEHLTDPRENYVKRLSELLEEGLRRAFEHNDPKRELNMQDVGAGLLSTAGEALERECPTIPFGAVTVRSDFSTSDGMLLVEFKLVKERSRVNSIQEEMAGDLMAAKGKGMAVLFMILDRGSHIPRLTDFVDAFEKQGDCWVTVVR
jgi:7-cyano-7-deazaguanine synthase in queuosine biosynthesis